MDRSTIWASCGPGNSVSDTQGPDEPAGPAAVNPARDTVMWRYGPRLSQLSPQSGNLIHSLGRRARGGTTIILPHWKSMSSKLFMENMHCVELLSLQAVGIYTRVWLHKSCIATVSSVTCDCDEWCACVGVFVCVCVCLCVCVLMF